MTKNLDELNLYEALLAVCFSIFNLGRTIKRFVLKKIEQLFFCFKRPKYKKGQRIVLWEKSYIIKGYYTDWEWCILYYNLEDSVINPSESLINFYMGQNE